MAILSTGFGKGMIFIFFAMAKEDNNLSSSKTCMITILPLKSIIGDQISEMLLLSWYSNGAYDRNSKFALRKSTSIFSIT